jgi:hypothetical protein
VTKNYLLNSFIVCVNATWHVADRDWLIASSRVRAGDSFVANELRAAFHRVLNHDKKSRDSVATLTHIFIAHSSTRSMDRSRLSYKVFWNSFCWYRAIVSLLLAKSHDRLLASTTGNIIRDFIKLDTEMQIKRRKSYQENFNSLLKKTSIST